MSLSYAAQLLACRLCQHARPYCERCCKTCTDTCNGRQLCYHSLPGEELVARSHILLPPEEEPMRKKLSEVPVSPAEKRDAALHMEMETLRVERNELINAEEAQAERERLIAQTHEAVGRIQAAGAFRKLATVAELVWLRDLKEAKIYRDLTGVGTWEKLCNYLGKDRRTTDEDLQNLATFGEDFLETSRQLSIGYREMRQLRQLQYDGESFQIADDGKTVIIEGEAILLGDDSAAPLIEGALEKLLIKNKNLADRNKKLEKEFKAAVNDCDIQQKELVNASRYGKSAISQTLNTGALPADSSQFIADVEAFVDARPALKEWLAAHGYRFESFFDILPDTRTPLRAGVEPGNGYVHPAPAADLEASITTLVGLCCLDEVDIDDLSRLARTLKSSNTCRPRPSPSCTAASWRGPDDHHRHTRPHRPAHHSRHPRPHRRRRP